MALPSQSHVTSTDENYLQGKSPQQEANSKVLAWQEVDEKEKELKRGGGTLRENDTALSLIAELDERWFRDNVVGWPSGSCCYCSPQSPPAVVEISPISPFRSIEVMQPVLLAPSTVSSSSGLRAAASFGPQERRQLPFTRLEGRRLSDGDCIPRRRLMEGGERKSKLRSADILRLEHHPHAKEEAPVSTVFSGLHVSNCGTQEELPASSLLTGQLTDVREDEELENDIFAKSDQISASLQLRLNNASSVNELRIPFAEINTECQTQAQRRPRRKVKGTRSLSDLEYDELRGWNDLGFEVGMDDLTPKVARMLPGLKIFASGDAGSQSLRISSPRVREYSPKHGMWISKPKSPFHIPASGEGGVDMKSQLKFWARAVASTVRIEC